MFRMILVALLAALPVLALGQLPTSPITVRVEGQGPDIILVPGLASSREVWSGVAATLRKNHRLHLVQVAGFAGTPPSPALAERVVAPLADALRDYIRRERLVAPTLIGHSLGGAAATMLAARHPASVGRLIIVDALPFYSLLFDPHATTRSVLPQAAAFRRAQLAASESQMTAMQTAAIEQLVKTPAARPAVLNAALHSDRQTVANAAYELMTTDLRPELRQITAPVRVIYAWDPRYGIAAEKSDALWHQAWATTPDISFSRIDQSFHFIMLDQPERFTRGVQAALDH